MRLFIGLRPSLSARASIASGFLPLRRISAVSWVPEDNLHLTLAFLGDVADSMLPGIQQAIMAAAENCPPQRFSYAEAAGVFPNWHSPRVIWLGINSADDELSCLHGRLWQGLLPMGFQADNRFHPHITLGRVKRQIAPEDLQHVKQTRWPAKSEMIGEITLFESILRPQGPTYKVLSSHAIGGGPGDTNLEVLKQ